MTTAIGLELSDHPQTKPAVSFGRNSLFDIFIVFLGGLPLYLPLALFIGEPRIAQNIPFDLIFWSNQLIKTPHIWATYVRLNRKVGEKTVNPIFGWPAYLAILTILILATIYGFFIYVWTAVILAQPFHYCRQIYGISRYMARPAQEGEMERKLCFWAYHLAMPLFIIGRWNVLYVMKSKLFYAYIPTAVPPVFMAALWSLAAAGLALGLGCEVWKWRRQSYRYDCSALFTLLVYFAISWYGFLSPEYFYSGFLVVATFHAVQYLGISWRMESRQSATNYISAKFLQSMPPAVSFLAFSVGLYLIGNFIQAHVLTLGNQFWPLFAGTCVSALSTHHYVADAALWTRRSGS